MGGVGKEMECLVNHHWPLHTNLYWTKGFVFRRKKKQTNIEFCFFFVFLHRVNRLLIMHLTSDNHRRGFYRFLVASDCHARLCLCESLSNRECEWATEKGKQIFLSFVFVRKKCGEWGAGKARHMTRQLTSTWNSSPVCVFAASRYRNEDRANKIICEKKKNKRNRSPLCPFTGDCDCVRPLKDQVQFEPTISPYGGERQKKKSGRKKIESER